MKNDSRGACWESPGEVSLSKDMESRHLGQTYKVLAFGDMLDKNFFFFLAACPPPSPLLLEEITCVSIY